jgi:peroxiredoxin Q/BCP
MLETGTKAPIFCLKNHNDEEVCTENLKGKWIVLYFYPKDNTPGCTKEACSFTENFQDFSNMNCEIIGISPDSPQSHTKFIKKYSLKHVLLSDTEKEVLTSFGVWQKKQMYGKEYMGVIRSTCIIDPDGVIRASWPKVKVPGHVEDVQAKLTELQAQ